jgi:hypothetical protein
MAQMLPEQALNCAGSKRCAGEFGVEFGVAARGLPADSSETGLAKMIAYLRGAQRAITGLQGNQQFAVYQAGCCLLQR